MKYKKKPAWMIALPLALALLLTGCAAVSGDTNELSNGTVQKSTDHNEKQQNVSEVQTSNLQALNTQDRYTNGKMFEAVSEDFVSSFQDKAAALIIPDARKGERATDILGSEDWENSTLLFLDSIPDQNIYLYGYNDADYPGCGLILDLGEEQCIYAFLYRYMTNTLLAPDLSTSTDGSKLYVSCHTGSGTGVSLSELYIFQVGNNQMEPYYVDINDLANCLGNKITMTYDTEDKKVTVYSDGKQLMTDSLISIGVVDGENITPDNFYCGDQIWYIIDGDSIRVSWVPTLYKQGAQCYLENMVSLEADINFTYDSNGNISGFDIGEVAAEGEEPVYQYTGKLSVAGRQQKCNIIVRKNQEANGGYRMDLTFIDSNSGETLQQLQYDKYRDDFMPDTIQDGSRILDVNHDGNDDIMLDLGVYGWAQLYACFVYDASVDKLLPVPGFEEHPFPDVLSDEGIVLFHEKSGAATYWVDKYQVKGNQLYMLGRLTQFLGQSGVRYTEEAMIDGALIKIQENVTAEEIENFDAWHMWT